MSSRKSSEVLSVFVTSPLPHEALTILKNHFKKVEVSKDHLHLTRKKFLKEIAGRDGVLTLLTDRIDEEALTAMRRAKVVANCAVGYNNIDVHGATRRGIMVTNTPGVLTDATADLTWALILSVARRIPEADRFLRAGKYKEWGLLLLLGSPVYGKTLGLVGAGRIGTAVAMRARGFNMNILYYDPFRNERIEKEVGARRVSLSQLLRKADIVSVHVPLDKSTHHLIGEKELNLMKTSALLVNTSRGEIIDEKALVEALRKGKIAGAGLDVYEHEPKVSPELKKLKNTVLLPHIGSATLETRTKMAVMAAQNLVAALEGRIPPNLVNPEVLKYRR
jgi:glyoxylate reductase